MTTKNMKFRTNNSIQILRDLRDLRGEEVFRRVLNVVGRFAQAAKTLKHCNTRFAEFGEFLNKNLFTLRPEPVLSDEGRLRGAISEPCFTSKPEDP